MRTTFALIIIALFAVPAASAQEQLVAILAVSSLDRVQGPWEILHSTLRHGGMLHIETSDGETSTLEIPDGSSIRIIGRKLKMKGHNQEFEELIQTTLVGDIMISITPTRLVSRNGKAAFNEAKTKLRFKDAAVVLSPYES